jgi:hypothetical protein
MANFQEAILKRATAAAEIVVLIVVLLLMIPRTGNYFAQRGELFCAGGAVRSRKRMGGKTAAFDS